MTSRAFGGGIGVGASGPDPAVASAPPETPPGVAVPAAGRDERKPRPPTVRYLGFRTTSEGREYTLSVADGLSSRVFVLLITHGAFASRETRFQDAPDLCFAKLHRELAADPHLVPGGSLRFTARELLDYRDARERRAPTTPRSRPAR
jgi:hypothetical protein